MDSRERYKTVMAGRIPDRPPINYLAHPEIDKRMYSHYGINSEDELLEILDTDFFFLSCHDISQNESHVPIYKKTSELEFSDSERTCPLGIRWRREVRSTKFGVDVPAIGGHPLANVETTKEILNHNWPKAEDFDFSCFHEEYEKHRDKVIIGGFWSGIFGDSYRLMGMERFLLDMALNPDLVKTLINRTTDMYLELNEKVFTEMKGKIDVWFWGNDFGMKSGLLFSEDMWSEFYYESFKKLITHAKSHDLDVMFHSCGSIAPLIPSLIDLGVDILDPVQMTADGMDGDFLKNKFGDQIIFHGGVDTHVVLPTGTPEEVYEHSLDVIRTLGKNGGYMFMASQVILPDVPGENVVAMYQAAKDFSYDSQE